MDISKSLADRVTPLKASAIREIFKLTGKPGMISFAGGIPSPDLFPTKEWGDILKGIMENEGAKALVYGVTEGYPPLTEKVIKMNAKLGNGKNFDRTIITTGAQQGIDLLIKSLVNLTEAIACDLGGLRNLVISVHKLIKSRIVEIHSAGKFPVAYYH